MWWVSFLLLLSRFYLCICLSTDWLWIVQVWKSLKLSCLEFIEFLGCTNFFLKLGNLSNIVSSKVLFSPFTLSSPSGTLIMHMFVNLMVSWCMRSCSLFSINFSFISWKWIISIFGALYSPYRYFISQLFLKTILVSLLFAPICIYYLKF